jgi:hypothetical protein
VFKIMQVVDMNLGGGRREFAVVCPRHGHRVHFFIFDRDMEDIYANKNSFLSLVDIRAQAALDEHCPGCQKPPMPATRWPNAGEDGGAEL